MSVKLCNIGFKSVVWLCQVGLCILEDLIVVGVVGVFVKVKCVGFKFSFNLLYLLEGVLQDCYWQELLEVWWIELVVVYDVIIVDNLLKKVLLVFGLVYDCMFELQDDEDDCQGCCSFSSLFYR